MKCGACGQINVHEALTCEGCGGTLEDWNPQSVIRKGQAGGAPSAMRAAPAKNKGEGFFSRNRPKAGVIPVGARTNAIEAAVRQAAQGRITLGNAGISTAPLQTFDKQGNLQSKAGSGLGNAGIAAPLPQTFDKQGKLQSKSGSNLGNAGIFAAPAQTFDRQGKMQSKSDSNLANAGISAAPAQTFDRQGKMQSKSDSNLANAGISAAPAQTFDRQGKLQSKSHSNLANAGIAAAPAQTYDRQGKLQSSAGSNLQNQGFAGGQAETRGPRVDLEATRGPLSRQGGSGQTSRLDPASGSSIRPYLPPGTKDPGAWNPPQGRSQASEASASADPGAWDPPQGRSQVSPSGVEGWTTPPPGTPSWSAGPGFTPPSVPADLAGQGEAATTDVSNSVLYEVASGYRGLLRSYGVALGTWFFYKIISVPTSGNRVDPALQLMVMAVVLIMVGAAVATIYNGMKVAGPVGCAFHPAVLLIFLCVPLASIFVVGALLVTSWSWLTNRGVRMEPFGPSDATLQGLKSRASSP